MLNTDNTEKVRMESRLLQISKRFLLITQDTRRIQVQ